MRLSRQSRFLTPIAGPRKGQLRFHRLAQGSPRFSSLQAVHIRGSSGPRHRSGLKSLNGTGIGLIVVMPGQASRTAEFMAFYRALESARPTSKRLFCDPFARHFLRPPLLNVVSLSRVPLLSAILCWYADRRAPGARTSAIARTRLIDEAWCQALRDGIRQIVILGSGFDCRPYRLPGAPSAIIFEVDIPERSPRNSPSSTSHLMPENVHYVEIDFHHRGLAETLVD